MKAEDFAKIYSHIVSPFPSAAVAVAIIVLTISPTVISLGYLLQGVLFLSIFPFILIFFYARKENVNVEFPDKSSRPTLFLPGFASYICSALLFYSINFREMFVLSLSYIVMSLTVLLITFRWKVSIHTSGLALPITALVYLYSLRFVWCYILVVLLVWARVKLRAHSFAQAVSGGMIGIAVTFAIFFLLLGT